MTNSTTAKRAIATTEDQGVTFVELFFDLVFVFSVTQIVGRDSRQKLKWLGDQSLNKTPSQKERTMSE